MSEETIEYRMENTTTMQTSTKSAWIKGGILLIFIGALAAFFTLGGEQWLSLEALKENRNALLNYTENNYLTMMVIAVLVYAVSTALSIPGGVVLSLAMGMLFGRWAGSGVILLGATLGATLVFLAARYLFADAARKRLGDGMAAKLINGFGDNAFHYLLFLRLVPLFPFWLVNLAPAFTSITTRTYVAATVIGILPGVFVFANLGQSLGRIESLDQLVSVETLLAFALLGLFALLPVLIKKYRSEKTDNQKTIN
jgi:uncharacterized membrane protein YdjX (TVP38/TMEM64 family)